MTNALCASPTSISRRNCGCSSALVITKCLSAPRMTGKYLIARQVRVVHRPAVYTRARTVSDLWQSSTQARVHSPDVRGPGRREGDCYTAAGRERVSPGPMYSPRSSAHSRFNKRLEDFMSLREFNDYLEDVEDISENPPFPPSQRSIPLKHSI